MKISIRIIKRWLKPIERTPLHPKWLLLKTRSRTVKLLKCCKPGTLLDIGCGNGWIRDILPSTINYIGLDYPKTMVSDYEGKPDIFADASSLPITDSIVHNVVMLSVLEHLAEPEQSFSEISRILYQGGQCFINVPFLYPLHDEPYDYQRWTCHGLRRLLEKYDLEIIEMTESTVPMETSALLMNIGLAKGLLDSMQQKSPTIFAAPLIISLIPLINIFGWVLGKFLPASGVMPCCYFIIAKKINSYF